MPRDDRRHRHADDRSDTRARVTAPAADKHAGPTADPSPCQKASAAIEGWPQAMTAGLSLDLARAAMLLQRAYDDEAAGLNPRPAFELFAGRDRTRRPRRGIGPLPRCAHARNGGRRGVYSREALWLDGDLAADADAFTGAAEQ